MPQKRFQSCSGEVGRVYPPAKPTEQCQHPDCKAGQADTLPPDRLPDGKPATMTARFNGYKPDLNIGRH